MRPAHVRTRWIVAMAAAAISASASVPASAQSDRTRMLEIARQRCTEDQWVLMIEPNHSSVGFSIPIMAGITRVTGKFTELHCVICYSEDDMTMSSVMFVTPASSVDTGIDARDEDLTSEKFFDIASTPDVMFASTRIEERGESWVAIGDLTMKGTSHEVQLPFVLTGLEWSESGRPTLGVALSTSIDRHEWGVGSDWVHSAIPGFLGDQVRIEVFMYTRSGRKLADLTQ